MAEIFQSFCNTKRVLRSVSILHLVLKRPTPSPFQRAKISWSLQKMDSCTQKYQLGSYLLKKSESIHPSHRWFRLIWDCLFSNAHGYKTITTFTIATFLLKKEKKKKIIPGPLFFHAYLKRCCVTHSNQRLYQISCLLPACVPGRARGWPGDRKRCLQVFWRDVSADFQAEKGAGWLAVETVRSK